ncbi:unnamed protein product, partial [marine sediment metagenome]
GAEALATGHYVRSGLAGNQRALYRPVDRDRDQSYFLFGTTAEQLEFLRFPLGAMSKAQTRQVARDMQIAVADKADSQDICFVPDGRYTDIIEKLRPGAAEPGDIVDLDGTALGRHDGIINYTIGQRRGLGIAADQPLYVVQLDADQARVVVGPRAALGTRQIRLKDFNWLGSGAIGDIPVEGLAVHARVRSTRPPVPGMLLLCDGSLVVELVEGEEGVAPGQACVLYDSADDDARVLGGGTIVAGAHEDRRSAA